MSNYKLQGTIVHIGETQVVSDKFSKREIVLNDNSMYPQDILFQFTQDKCSILDNFKVGQDVNISFNLRGRAWTNPQGETKYFNTLEGWRIESTGNALNPNDNFKQEQPVAQDEDDQDLPF